MYHGFVWEREYNYEPRREFSLRPKAAMGCKKMVRLSAFAEIVLDQRILSLYLLFLGRGWLKETPLPGKKKYES